MVSMNVLQFDVCSNWIAYLLRDLWDAIFISYVSVRRHYSVNSLSIAHPVVFSCRCFATWHGSNLRLLLCCAFIALVSSALMLGDPVAMQRDMVREVQLWDAGYSQLSATPRCCSIESCSCSFGRRCLLLYLRPGDCWFIIEWIICYILHRY